MKHIHKAQLLRLLEAGGDFNPPAWQPTLDIYRTPKGWLLKFELAGVHLEDVKLEIRDRTVSLSGTRRDLCCGESCVHHTMEIAYSRFERSVEFPQSLEGSRVSTEVANGMLLVQIETAQP